MKTIVLLYLVIMSDQQTNAAIARQLKDNRFIKIREKS